MKFLKTSTAIFALLCSTFAFSGDALVIASTTSTDNSGLYKYILPIFTDKTGIKTKIIAQGTGQAIETARRGDADVLFVHHKPSELKFVKNGFGVKRYDVMYNDFVIIGSKSDPAKLATANTVEEAFRRIAKAKIEFISRGDNSGTNKKELSLWKMANTKTDGKWYIQSGSGMGATLNMASAKNAYTISDRSTWLAFNNKGDLDIVFEGSTKLFNQYGVIAVNPKKHPHVKYAKAQKFISWFISSEGQKYIKEFKIKGKQAFFPNAR